MKPARPSVIQHPAGRPLLYGNSVAQAYWTRPTLILMSPQSPRRRLACITMKMAIEVTAMITVEAAANVGSEST